MTGGAATVAPARRGCDVAGCTRPHLARGYCATHYRRWAIANPDIRQTEQIERAMLAAMPATQKKLIEVTGHRSETLRRALVRMQQDQRLHIGDYQPPVAVGTRFMPVYYAGPGEDAKVTRKERREQANRTARNGHRRRQTQWQLATLPPSARWAAALLAMPGKSKA